METAPFSGVWRDFSVQYAIFKRFAQKFDFKTQDTQDFSPNMRFEINASDSMCAPEIETNQLLHSTGRRGN
jgi:hypothetical protein